MANVHNIEITVDLDQMKEQKIALLHVQEHLKEVGAEVFDEDGNNVQTGCLDGIVNLIDGIQDYAADTLGLDEKIVFKLSNDKE